jgi:hypothetical protein
MSVRPMVWKRPNWPDEMAWMGDCLIRGCSYSVEGDTLVVTADELRDHVLIAHPKHEQAERIRAELREVTP